MGCDLSENLGEEDLLPFGRVAGPHGNDALENDRLQTADTRERDARNPAVLGRAKMQVVWPGAPVGTKEKGGPIADRLS